MAGRFAHEAAAFDPRNGHLYLTEDNFGFPSGLYRYAPPSNPMETDRLEDGGADARRRGRPERRPRSQAARRCPLPRVTWVDIDDPNPTFPHTPGQTAPTANNDALRYVGNQGLAQGAARFSRLEGAVFERDVVYLLDTGGGAAAEQRRHRPGITGGARSGPTRREHAEPRLPVTWSRDPRLPGQRPPGRALVLCEDNTNDNYLRVLSTGGRLSDLALNRLRKATGADRSGDEFAGATFSPGGETLYVNIQASRWMSFAIWGPWHHLGI